ncbi:GNAT family N-acetyltransferase [uncultured Thomasclavelia sp.]|nr:GNAT family N-acetyltransferase [uncultured Thomasclavelia sp.]
MHIRLLKEDDIKGIYYLLKNVLGYTVSFEEFYTRVLLMSNDENYYILVACNESQVIGFIGLQLGYAFEITGKVMRIIALAVANEYQNKGIGKQLVKESEKFALKDNATVITLNSGLSRLEAHKFYEKQGFYKKGYSFMKKV